MADEQVVPSTHPTPPPPTAWIAFLQACTALLTVIIETFGWAGALLLGGLLFIVWYATAEQKQAIIDLYVLGKGIGNVWPLIVISAVFVGTAVAQHKWYQKALASKSREIDRLGDQKSKLQEKLLGKPLQHTKPREKARNKS